MTGTYALRPLSQAYVLGAYGFPSGASPSKITTPLMLTTKLGRTKIVSTYWNAFRHEASFTRKWLGTLLMLLVFPVWLPLAIAFMLLSVFAFVGMWLWTGICELGVALRSEEYRDAREQKAADRLTALQRRLHMNQREMWDVMHKDED